MAPRLGPWQLVERVGEGASSSVWRARHAQTGRLAAVKRAKEGTEGAAATLLREAHLLARVGRRWGPALVDVGPDFLVAEWVEGVPVGDRLRGATSAQRDLLAGVVAHAVGRALEELHQAGVHHGDVKAANVLCATTVPARDAAEDRGATLIDLGLAGELGSGALGGTPRYASPELRERAEAGPASDLWALGVLLAEILDPAVERSVDPVAAVAAWDVASPTEPMLWVQALLAQAPGGRPSAEWLARRAARRLELRSDAREIGQARVDRVRRAYLAQRAGDPDGPLSPIIGEPARGWIEGASAATRGLAGPGASDAAAGAIVEPLGAVRRSRWLVALVGPSAAAWPLGVDDAGERALVARVAELARAREPASWTLEDVLGQGEVRALEWRAAEGSERASRLVRELARSAPRLEALALAEDDVAGGLATPTLALQLAAALARAGETGRAWVALAAVEGAEADEVRAEIARRRGNDDEARRMATRVLAADAGEWSWNARATLARLAWDTSDLDGADRLVEGARGAAAATVRALVALRRGAYDAGLRAIDQALLESVDAEGQSRLESVRGLLELGRGGHASALAAFARAVELATRAGAVVDEATYLTSEASAATDAGDMSRSLASATRAALLWERLGRPERAARAWLARAGRSRRWAPCTRPTKPRARPGREGSSRATPAPWPTRAGRRSRCALRETRPPARGPSRRAIACKTPAAKTPCARRPGGWSGPARPSTIAPSREATRAPPARAPARDGNGGARERERSSPGGGTRATGRSWARCCRSSTCPRRSGRAVRRSTPRFASRPTRATATRRGASRWLVPRRRAR